jgi:hypothetical protein
MVVKAQPPSQYLDIGMYYTVRWDAAWSSIHTRVKRTGWARAFTAPTAGPWCGCSVIGHLFLIFHPIRQCESRRNLQFSGQGGIVKERKANIVIVGCDLDPVVSVPSRVLI